MRTSPKSANLKKTNEVRVAGVKVGTVTSVGLEGDHVLVKFRVRDGVSLGSLTKASIRIKTLVGAEYLSLDPEGGGKLDPKHGHPGLAHDTAVRRRPRVPRSGDDRRQHRHRAS